MSGRNWTRKSIEELVEAYLRKKKPSKGGSVSFGAMLSEWHQVRICDSAPNGDPYLVTIGNYNSSYETVEGSHYYPLASGNTHGYLMADDASDYRGNPKRYQVASGTSDGYNPSYSGSFRNSNGDVFKFNVLTFSRKCNIDDFPAVLAEGPMVRTDGGSRPCVAIVTSDHENESIIAGSNARINRTIYIPYHNGRWREYYGLLSAISIGESVTISSSNGGTYHRKVAGMDLADPTYALFPQYVDAKYPFSIVGGYDGGTNVFYDYVDQHYEGSIEYNKTDSTKTRDTTCCSIIMLDNIPSSVEEFETYVFMLSRWFLDSTTRVGDIQDIPQVGSAQYGVDLPHKLTGDSGDIVVKYNRVEVNI